MEGKSQLLLSCLCRTEGFLSFLFPADNGGLGLGSDDCGGSSHSLVKSDKTGIFLGMTTRQPDRLYFSNGLFESLFPSVPRGPLPNQSSSPGERIRETIGHCGL